MFDNIFFCNRWHNGDLHYSREFIKDVINKIKAQNYYFAYDKVSSNALVLKDIKTLKFIDFDSSIHIESQLYKIDGRDLYINSWAGAALQEDFLKMSPNKGIFYCNLDNIYRIISTLYPLLGIVPESKEFYIPSIDYNVLEKTINSNIDNYVNKHRNVKVLVSNGNVLSGQASNFNMNGLIDLLSMYNPGVIFIMTDSSNRINKPNVHYTQDIIKVKGCDLVEISYLSTFCDVIIGRGSGPYCLTITKENVINKKFVGIGIKQPDILWCEMNDSLFINNNNPNFMFNEINKYLNS